MIPAGPLHSKFVIHRHRTGRIHFDLRVGFPEGVLRSWSLLKEPPARNGEKRLAIERESFPESAAAARSIEEQAFGYGKIFIWDEGDIDIQAQSPESMTLTFRGKKISGVYQMLRMRWYPGNRWILTKQFCLDRTTRYGKS